jgi:hypothetical protein
MDAVLVNQLASASLGTFSHKFFIGSNSSVKNLGSSLAQAYGPSNSCGGNFGTAGEVTCDGAADGAGDWAWDGGADAAFGVGTDPLAPWEASACSMKKSASVVFPSGRKTNSNTQNPNELNRALNTR